MIDKGQYLGPSRLIRDPSDKLVLRIKISGQFVLLMVDTGADVSVLDASVAAKLKLKLHGPEGAMTTFSGESKYRGAVVRDAELGPDLPLPAVMWAVTDMSDVRKFQKENDIPMHDGVLGMDILGHLGAVIDCKRLNLHLCPPLFLEGGLQGDWLAEPVGTDGKPGPVVKWNLSTDKLTVDVGDKTTRFRATVLPDRPEKELHLVDDPSPDLFRQCRYEFRGDRLIVAGPLLPGDDVKAVPDAVEPPKPGKPKYSVLTFRRPSKPSAPVVTPAAPPARPGSAPPTGR